MSSFMPYLLSSYVKDLTKKISDKYGLAPMDSLRRFLFSETYAMLTDESLEMWEFSSNGIFDMWETEQITGTPRNSLYLRRDEYV